MCAAPVELIMFRQDIKRAFHPQILRHVLYVSEIRLRKLVDEREKMIEQVSQLSIV